MFTYLNYFLVCRVCGFWLLQYLLLLWCCRTASYKKWTRDSIFWLIRVSAKKLKTFGTWKVILFFKTNLLYGFRVMPAISSWYHFSSIRARAVSPGKSCLLVCSRANMSAHSITRNMTITSSGNIVTALIISDLFYSIPAAQTERASTPRFLSASKKLEVLDNSSWSSGFCDDQSFSVLLKKTMKKLVDSKE